MAIEVRGQGGTFDALLFYGYFLLCVCFSLLLFLACTTAIRPYGVGDKGPQGDRSEGSGVVVVVDIRF